MKEVDQKSVAQYEEPIGSDGAIMKLRMEACGKSKKVYGRVLKDGKEVAFVSREEEGQIILNVKSPDLLNGEEFADVFHKSCSCIAELCDIELPTETEE